MKGSYQIVDRKDTKRLKNYLLENSEALSPIVEMLEASRIAVDELIEVLGRASIEAVLHLSAASVAGDKHRGWQGVPVGWHGTQRCSVPLSDRKVRLSKPSLRRKGRGEGGEVAVPAYEAIAAGGSMGERILEILMHNVSTRSYGKVITEMTESVGVSRSAVSRQFVESSAHEPELSPSQRRCLGMTNVIESPLSGVRLRTRRVSRWRNGKMVLRWAALAFLSTE